MSAYLSDMLRHVDVTIIKPNEIHHYQPGHTLITADIFTPAEIAKPTQQLIPRHVKWLKDSVTELNPEGNSLTTAKNGRVSYDFLVLVPDCQMDFDLVMWPEYRPARRVPPSGCKLQSPQPTWFQ